MSDSNDAPCAVVLVLSRPAAVFLRATVAHMNQVKILPPGTEALRASAWLEEIEAAASVALVEAR